MKISSLHLGFALLAACLLVLFLLPPSAAEMIGTHEVIVEQ